MRRFALLIIIILSSFSYSCSQEGMVSPVKINRHRFEKHRLEQHHLEQHGSVVSPGKVTDATDIHYSSKYCTVCHDQTPRNGNKFLKYKEDYKQLCRCHYKTTLRDIHASDIVPPKDFKKRMPKDFPLRDGKITCITCHNIFAQCRNGKTYEALTTGQNFLRGAPYKKLSDLCYKCHDKTRFEKYNPHNQLDKNGKIVELKCLYCHKKVPDVKKEGYKDVTLIGNLKPLCVRCHNKADKESLHAKHLRKPPPKVLAKMKKTEMEFGIVLPLDRNGNITCATCHNPHEKGVIPANRPGAKGAGTKYRRRLSGNICIRCHEM